MVLWTTDNSRNESEEYIMKRYIAIPCVMSVSLLGLSCTDEALETPQEPGAKPPQEDAEAEVNAPPEAKPEVVPAKPEVAPAKDLGSVSAKANEEEAVLDFKVATAVVTNAYDKFSISLSDVADDPVRDSGQFPPVDDEEFHHRILLRFGEVPTAPGKFPVGGLNYYVKDEETTFNFGWSGDSVSGTVTVDKLAGELPAGEYGVRARPESVEGSFDVTNKYGGVFKGTFKAAAVLKAAD